MAKFCIMYYRSYRNILGIFPCYYDFTCSILLFKNAELDEDGGVDVIHRRKKRKRKKHNNVKKKKLKLNKVNKIYTMLVCTHSKWHGFYGAILFMRSPWKQMKGENTIICCQQELMARYQHSLQVFVILYVCLFGCFEPEE